MRIRAMKKQSQNKPNLLDAQMNVSSILTKDYENKPRLRALGKQTQSNPILSAIALAKADSKGAPMLRFYSYAMEDYR